MRSFNVKHWSCIGILAVLAAIFVGCGSGNDLLDEVGQRYTASVEIEDNGEGTLTVDIAQDMCDSDWEDYGPAIANVTIAAATDAPGITLQSYTIEYIPQLSPNSLNVLVMPPDLADGFTGSYSVDIAPGGSSTFSLTCISSDTKEEYRTKAGWTVVDNRPTEYYWVKPQLEEGRYTIRFTFNFLNTEGQTETITKDATVWLGDFDNC
jgi:hypothetical protein